MRQLALEGRITIFKSLGVSKITHFLVTKRHNYTIDLLCKYRINQSTLCNRYMKRGG